MHLPLPGGRRKTNPDSKNSLESESLSSHADYMETIDFKKDLQELKEIRKDKIIAFMCSGAVW